MSKTTDTKKDTVKGIIGECIMYIPIFLLSVLFIMLVLTMFSDSAAKLIGYLFCIGIGDDSEIEIIQLLIWMISRMFVVIGLVFLIQRADSMREVIEKMVGKWIVPISAVLFIVLLVVFVSFIFFDDMEEWVRNLLDVKYNKDKIAIIELLGWMMSGVLAVVGVVGLNRRAEAQVKSNKLVENEHTQERLKTAAEHLGHCKASVRISAFYEYLHLIKDNEGEYRKSILNILYAHIRAATSDFANSEDVKNAEQKDERIKPTEEIQGLLDILFKSQEIDRSDVKPNLQRVYFSGADLSHGDLSDVDLSKADLSEVNLSEAKMPGANLSEAKMPGVNLSGAKMSGVNLSKAKLSRANLSGAILLGANLSGAFLPRANLFGANLSRANLSRANLSGANLSRADLSGAKISGAFLPRARLFEANLSGADLSRAFLPGANLSGSDLSGTNLSDADLSKVQLGGASYTNETQFPEWLRLLIVPPDDGDKVQLPLRLVAPESSEDDE